MNERQRISKDLKEIKNHNPSADPPTLQAKRLQELQVDTLLELIKTLNKIDRSNKKLEKSNLRVARTNLVLQVMAVIVAIAAIYTAVHD